MEPQPDQRSDASAGGGIERLIVPTPMQDALFSRKLDGSRAESILNVLR